MVRPQSSLLCVHRLVSGGGPRAGILASSISIARRLVPVDELVQANGFTEPLLLGCLVSL